MQARSLLLLILVALPLAALPQAAPHATQAAETTFTVAPTEEPPDIPLPRGCGSVTPPGQTLAACCVSGFVYIDGEPVAGAEVTITRGGASVVVYTQVYSGTESRPYFAANLSSEPLRVAPGETVTIKARYSSHERTITHQVVAGSQQVDVVLAKRYAEDYVFERQIWNQAQPGGLNSPHDVAVNSLGHIYVVDSDNSRIQVFDQNGNIIRTWGRRGVLPGMFDRPSGIAIDASGNIYIADSGNHRIQKFDMSGALIAYWGGYGKSAGQFWNPTAISIADNGNVYVADQWNHRIQVFRSDGTFITQWGSYGAGNGQFNNPTYIAIDRVGNVYVADHNNSRVQKFSAQGHWLQSWAVSSWPLSMAADKNNNIYVASFDRIWIFNQNGQLLSSWGSPGKEPGQLSNPLGIALGDDGFIYIAEQSADRVQKLKIDGTWQATYGSKGVGNGQLSLPHGMTLSPVSADILYVADYGNNRIQTFSPTGSWQAVLAQIPLATDIVMNTAGHIYVSENQNDQIIKLSSSGQILAAWGGVGSANGQFNGPFGLAIDAAGNIYVADYWNHRIQKFDAEGRWLLSWGNYGSANGQFNRPTDIAIDSKGNIYVADPGNRRVQKFNANTQWIASWMIETSANPRVITVDNQDNLYVYSNYKILKFTSSGQFVTRWGEFGVRAGEIWDTNGLLVHPDGRVYVSDDTNRIQIFRPMTYTRPIATIVSVSDTVIEPGETLVLRGMGQDSDETPGIAAYQWVSDKDGVIGTSATLTVSNLSPGTHAITLRVQDTEGEWSAPIAAESVYIAPPPEAAWTMLLYLSGDYPDLTYASLNNALLALAGRNTIGGATEGLRNPAIRVAALIDGPASGDTRFVTIEPGTATRPPIYQEIPRGEKAMDHPATLRQFILEGQQTFPARHYYLAIADHGQGTTGIAWDYTSDLADNGRLDFSAYLTNAELRQALAPGSDNLAPIDILHLDACSMNMLELAYELREHVDYLIAYQYVGWNSFAYYDYWRVMGENARPMDVARDIAKKYAQIQESRNRPYTVSALDLSAVAPVHTALNALSLSLTSLYNNNLTQQTQRIAQIRNSSRVFDDHDDDLLNQPASIYVDLADWAARLRDARLDPAVTEQAIALLNALRDGPAPLIIPQSNHYRSAALSQDYIDLSGTNGVSIFYPLARNTPVFRSYVGNLLFAMTSQSQWPLFLTADGIPLPPGPFDPLPGPAAPVGEVTYTVHLPLAVR